MRNDAQTERNREIYNDKESGMSWKDLVIKYKLSQTTLRAKYQNEKYRAMKEKLEAAGLA